MQAKPVLDNVHELQSAFERFRISSTRLEARHRRLQEEIRQLQAELERKDVELAKQARLATLGEMAALVAHEVRNPLGAMKLFLSLLRGETPESPGAMGLLNQLDGCVEQLDRVVTNILLFSRERMLTLGPCNLHGILAEQAMILETRSGGTFKVALDCASPLFLRANEEALRTIFSNLFLNALEASGGNGSLSVQVIREESEVVVHVRDSGPGIPAEILPRIFEPFVTGKNAGTGLGLALVQQMMNCHGGTVHAENQGGAHFTLRFPQSRAEESR